MRAVFGILDRYILRSFLLTFFSSVFLFVSLILFFDMIQQLKFFIEARVPFPLVLEMYFYKIFYQFTLVSPAGAMFAAIYTINRMARDNELIAIINSGMSIYRLSRTVIIFGFLFSVGLIPFNDHVVFPATRRAEKISDLARKGIREERRSQGDVKLWPGEGIVYKAQYYNHQQQELQNLIVVMQKPARELAFIPEVPGKGDDPAALTNDYLHDVREYRPREALIFRVEAQRALYLPKRKGWMLYNGLYRRAWRGGTLVFPFTERFFPFPVEPYDFAHEQGKLNAMTTAEASRYIEKLQKSGKPCGKELVEYYLKFSFPLINFVIILIGISLGGFSRKAVLFLSFFVAVVVYFLYYSFVAFGISLGKLGSIPPLLGAWMGNLVFFALSIVLLHYRKT